MILMKKMITGISTVYKKAPAVQREPCVPVVPRGRRSRCPRVPNPGSAPGAAVVLRELTLVEGLSLISHCARPVPFD